MKPNNWSENHWQKAQQFEFFTNVLNFFKNLQKFYSKQFSEIEKTFNDIIWTDELPEKSLEYKIPNKTNLNIQSDSFLKDIIYNIIPDMDISDADRLKLSGIIVELWSIIENLKELNRNRYIFDHQKDQLIEQTHTSSKNLQAYLTKGDMNQWFMCIWILYNRRNPTSINFFKIETFLKKLNLADWINNELIFDDSYQQYLSNLNSTIIDLYSNIFNKNHYS